MQAFLQRRLGSVSLRCIKRFLDERRCRLNGQVERFAKAIVRRGMKVELDLVERSIEKPKILFEDEVLIAFDKPAGLTYDRVTSGHLAIHRLDRETSGLLLFAKDAAVQQLMEEQFRQREIFKQYLALVEGIPAQPRGVVDNYLGQVGQSAGQTVWGEVASRRGKRAVTRYQIVKRKGHRALIACVPQTGRTHQIRIHLAGLGAPVVGDELYGSRRMGPGRHLLHAQRLIFTHPVSGATTRLEAPAPKQEFRL